MREFQIREGESLIRVIRGVRDEWVYVGFGGLTAAADALNTTRQAIYSLHKNGIRTRDIAINVHDALLRARKYDIPIGELLELPDHPWMGPERNGTTPVRGGKHAPKGSSPRLIPLAEKRKLAGEGADAGAPTNKLGASKKRASRRNAPAQNRTGTYVAGITTEVAKAA